MVIERSEGWGFDLFWKDEEANVLAMLSAKVDGEVGKVKEGRGEIGDDLTVHKGLAMLERHADRIPEASIFQVFQVRCLHPPTTPATTPATLTC